MFLCYRRVFVGERETFKRESDAARTYFQWDDTTSRLDYEVWSNFKEWVRADVGEDEGLVAALRRVMDLTQGDITDDY